MYIKAANLQLCVSVRAQLKQRTAANGFASALFTQHTFSCFRPVSTLRVRHRRGQHRNLLGTCRTGVRQNSIACQLSACDISNQYQPQLCGPAMLRRHLVPHLYTGNTTDRTLSLPAWLAVIHFRRSPHTEGRISAGNGTTMRCNP